MTVAELKAKLDEFDPNAEFIVAGPPDEGDADFPILGIDAWDVGKGAVVLSIQTNLEEPTPQPQTPENIAGSVGELDPGTLGVQP